jgi:hypothetical protein
MLRCRVRVGVPRGGSPLALDVGARPIAHPRKQCGSGLVRVDDPRLSIQGSKP